MKYVSVNLDGMKRAAGEYVDGLKSGSTATIVGLFGDLGSGKTTFTQAAAMRLGVTEVVTSPTFIIEKIYKLAHPQFSYLIHIDAYRLGSGSELVALGWNEITADPKNLVFIEWPEKISDILPATIKKIRFRFVNETTREIEVE